MKEIKAYKCGFCKKIYENRSSCRSHEYKCYLNPRTRSCAGCGFLSRAETKILTGRYYEYNACLVNHSIFKKMKAKCPDYVDKNKEQSVLLAECIRSQVFDEQRSDSKAKNHYKQLQIND